MNWLPQACKITRLFIHNLETGVMQRNDPPLQNDLWVISLRREMTHGVIILRREMTRLITLRAFSLCCKLYGTKCVVTSKMADGLLRERWVSLFIINNFFFLKTLNHDTHNILWGGIIR